MYGEKYGASKKALTSLRDQCAFEGKPVAAPQWQSGNNAIFSIFDVYYLACKSTIYDRRASLWVDFNFKRDKEFV